MDYRQLGNSDIKISTIGLGTNNFGMRCDMAQSQAVIDGAIDSGVTFFDTADAYPTDPELVGTSEKFLGAALGDRRKDVIVATKFGMPMGEGLAGASPAYVKQACEASLQRLGTDYIDLYQVHFPDPTTPIEDTLGALNELIKEGKVRAIGGSNYTGYLLAEVQMTAKAMGAEGFVSMQNYYNLLRRDVEFERLPAARHFGVSFLPYFPLASGMLTGKYKRDTKPGEDTRFGAPSGMAGLAGLEMNDRAFDIVESVEAFAAERGLSVLEVAIGWLLAQDGVASVMAGATKPEQVATNAAAAGTKLSDDDVAALNDMAPPLGGLPF